MKRLTSTSTGKPYKTIFSVEQFIDSKTQGESCTTSIREVNNMIHRLVCSGYNEGSWDSDSHQEWERTCDITDKHYKVVIFQHYNGLRITEY